MHRLRHSQKLRLPRVSRSAGTPRDAHRPCPVRRRPNRQDRLPEGEGNGRHDGVPQPGQAGTAVHPGGKPINHSTHSGFSRPPTASLNGQARRRAAWLAQPAFQSRARGVGHHEDALPPVRRSGMGSTHHERPAGVARRLQLRHEPVRSAKAQAKYVLNQHPTGSALPHQPQHVPPQPAARPVEPGAEPGDADVLAWEAATDEVWRGNAVGRQPGSGQRADVIVARHRRPVTAQDPTRVRLLLAQGDDAQAGTLEPEAEAPDAAEQVKDVHKVNLGNLA